MQPSKPYIIAGLAFGEPWAIEPNMRLAKLIGDFATIQARAVIVTQGDIQIGEGFDVTYVNDVHAQKEKIGRPATTLMVCRGAMKKAQELGISEIWYAAGKPHKWRVERDLKKVAKEMGMRVSVKIIPGIVESNYASWFNKASVQTRTQSLWQGWWYEPLFRLIPFWFYEKVASGDRE